jgi:hypothetical protein
MIYFLIASFLCPVSVIVLLVTPPCISRRIFVWLMLVTLPTMLTSCLTLASQGDAGMFSVSQLVCEGSIILAVSYGIAYLALEVSHAWDNRMNSPEEKPEPWDLDLRGTGFS